MSLASAVLLLALALAAAAVQAMAGERLAPPRDAGWAAAFGGGFLAVVLMAVDRGRILRWRYDLGAGADLIELPGAALVLGLALLASLAGALSMAAHLLSTARPASRARLLGQKLLVLGAGLGALGAGVVAALGLSRDTRALAAGATQLAALLVAVGLLVVGLRRLLAPPATPGAPAKGILDGSARLLRLAAAAAALAAALAGVEAWWTVGSYATAPVAAAAAAALLGVAAVQATRFGWARTALFLLGLLAAV